MKKSALIIMAVLALIAASYFTGRYYSNKEKSIALSNITALRDSIRTYQKEIGGLRVDVYEKGRLILSQKEAISAHIVEKEALRKLNIKNLADITSLRIDIDILMDSIKHNGQIIYTDTMGLKPAILLPFNFSKENKNYKFTGDFDISGIMNCDFSLTPANVKIYGGIDKKGNAKLFITTDNDLIKFGEIESTQISYPKQKRFGIGFSVGYGVLLGNPVRLAPFIGISLNYNFIRF